MSYSVDILADSVSNSGARLTTFEAVFPRFILAEVNTHRMLSRNSASSRAIPTEKFIASIKEDPFIPKFNERVVGMGVGEPLIPLLQTEAQAIWQEACENALWSANQLLDLGVDKSRANRLLEPFMWHTAIITATDWENFFALRCPDTDEVDINFPAQLEFQQLAILMRRALINSKPRYLEPGQWHIPLVEWDEQCDLGVELSKKVAVGRLARRSSYNRKDPESIAKSAQRHDDLSNSGHWSPFEHVATPMDNYEWNQYPWSGNFLGWNQYRKYFPNEWDFSAIRYGEDD